MSQENVELVRRIYDGWSRGDFGVGADLLAGDFEWQQHAEAVEPGSHRGVAIGHALEKIFEVYADRRDALEAAGLSE
jgi:ketosteroid isomerase-like protein